MISFVVWALEEGFENLQFLYRGLMSHHNNMGLSIIALYTIMHSSETHRDLFP